MLRKIHNIPQVAAMRPDQFVQTLAEISDQSATVLATFADKLVKDIDLFYPPQIIDAFAFFARHKFAHSPRLFTAFTGRLDDLLVRPASPKRLTQIAGIFARLQMPLGHPEIWEGFRSALLQQMSGLRQGIVGLTVALHTQGLLTNDEELSLGLATQARILRNKMSPAVLSQAQYWQVVEELVASGHGDKFPINYETSDDLRAKLLQHHVHLRVSLPAVAQQSLQDLVRALKDADTADFVRIVTDATKLNLYSPQLAEECFARLEHVSGNMWLRLLFAAVKLNFLENRSQPIFDLLLAKHLDNSNQFDFSSNQNLVLARLALFAGADQKAAALIASRVSPWELSLEERRLFWDVQEPRTSVQPRLPLVPQSMTNQNIKSQIFGPHTLIHGNTLYRHRWRLVGVELPHQTAAFLAPDVWITKHALQTRHSVSLKLADISS